MLTLDSHIELNLGWIVFISSLFDDIRTHAWITKNLLLVVNFKASNAFIEFSELRKGNKIYSKPFLVNGRGTNLKETHTSPPLSANYSVPCMILLLKSSLKLKTIFFIDCSDTKFNIFFVKLFKLIWNIF